ncbi:hypothetical protein KIW84_025218 [Lathyrus oleraceus]|uniref:Retrovirus-related Pol polyprotein from transposon TNT 1-94-like beta-barrel domain-containing protein n=1 Tax=Pisum sativum TaxID=3888 RepID=A0A9D4YHR9_PEA|nr:hypothetical protein KIW84_025218 [Pisum sativum]
MVLMTYTDTLRGDRDDIWFIDSGCSNHMCGNSSLLCDLEKGFNKVVRLGNYASKNVVGKESVRLTVKGVNHLVRDVYYVPGLKNNILIVGKLQERGLDVLMQANMCRIYHHTKGLIFKTTMAANRMFMLLSNTRSVKQERDEECLQDVIFEEEEQWNWERSFEDDRRFDLEWEDGNGEEVEDSDDGSEEEKVASPVRDESSDGNEEDEAAPPMKPRVRRAPTYLNDFVSGDGLSDEGEEVVQFNGGIFISRAKYVMKVLRHFGMEHSNSIENPMVPGFKISKDENGIEMDGSFFKQLIGSMMYLTAKRPDIMYAVSLLSRYMSRPTEVHHSEAKRILRYLQGKTTFGILYRRGGSHELIGFTDSDYVRSVEDRRSTSGYVFMLSGAVVTWSSRK